MVYLLQRYTFILIGVVSLTARAQQFRVDTLARAPQTQFPSSIAFVPGGGGAFFFSEKSTGRVRVFDHGLRAAPFLTLPVDDEAEQGLLGLALHPSYPDSPFVYVYYVRARDRAGVLERYIDIEGIGTSPQLLLFIARRDEATSSNGGTIRFGPDGKLFLAVGDHGVKPSNAQDTLGGRNLRGKILRLNSDGSIPDDNILPRRYYWSLGHRNPGGIAFDPATGDLYATEGGTQYANEIIIVPRGANLGWPGKKPSSLSGGFPPKIFLTWTRGEQPALTGVCVYRGDAFPRFRGKLLFTGNANPTLWVASPSTDGDSIITEQLYKSNTGFSDVQVGPDGLIYAAVGPYLGSRLLRFSPLPPHFSSNPPPGAAQDQEYIYAPQFRGTPPDVELLAGPAGMYVDNATWTLHWKPTNAQALEGVHTVILRAQNGAGNEDQRFTVAVKNTNDPPSAFSATIPADGAELRFLGEDPRVMFRWLPAMDPDGDTLRYVLQMDTVSTFTSPARMDVTLRQADSALVRLPSASRSYFWRVTASDGALTTLSSPGPFRLHVVFSRYLGREKAPPVESVLEQNFPNPFNPSTSIKYTLPRGGHVRLTVFNLLGQEVGRMIDGTQAEGTYEVEFTKSNLPSGIYFYRLVAPGFAETKKMVIAR